MRPLLENKSPLELAESLLSVTDREMLRKVRFVAIVVDNLETVLLRSDI